MSMCTMWPNAKIFYCRDCKKTFVVTPEEWTKCKLRYEFEINQWRMHGPDVAYMPPPFILKEHVNWEYREDQDYEHI